jgi:Cu+-exporting ATPase
MTTELSVGGMTCASCVAQITRAIKKVPGVEDASVNLATEQATVEHSADLSANLLVAAIEKAGYDASVVVDREDDADAERREAEIRRRGRLLAFGVALFVPTLVLGMFVADFPGKDWLLLALTVPVWAVVGAHFHRGAIAALRQGTATMDTLVSLGSTAALAYSIFATLTMQPSYYETASAIVTLVFIGKYLESVAKGRSNRAMRALLDLRPVVARRIDADGVTHEVRADRIAVGERVMVTPGDRVPVDGVVIEGESVLDVAALTGEPIPVDVVPGASVRTGSVNGDGTLVIRATAVGAGTTLARIVEVVRKAQGTTPPVQRLADRVASVFVPVILAIAGLTFVGWGLTGHSWVSALVAAVAVLVVACPCALGLATPTAIMVGVGAGAARGVLFRDAEALERLARVDIVLFDKTGTLTRGRPEVVEVQPAPSVQTADVLAVAAAVERGSSHPLAGAVVRAATSAGIAPMPASESVTVRGRGVRALVDGSPAYVGTPGYLRDQGILAGEVEDAVRSTVAVAHGTRYLGTLLVADEARPESREAIAALRQLGLSSWIVSGDADGPTAALAKIVGATGHDARMTPEGKADVVRALQTDGSRVVFVGDGINDAPALATADVGVAMGGGTDVAMETAQATILSNDPRALAAAVRLSRATVRTIRQNLFWAFAYNAILVPLAAFGIVRPLFAAAAMGLSSLFVVGNSLLLRRR